MTTDKGTAKTWRKACACRVASSGERSSLRVLRGDTPCCARCGTPWTLVEKTATEGVSE